MVPGLEEAVPIAVEVQPEGVREKDFNGLIVPLAPL